jgi:hypothetical protein
MENNPARLFLFRPFGRAVAIWTRFFSASVGFLAVRGHAAQAGFDLIVESVSILNREIFVNELY